MFFVFILKLKIVAIFRVKCYKNNLFKKRNNLYLQYTTMLYQWNKENQEMLQMIISLHNNHYHFKMNICDERDPIFLVFINFFHLRICNIHRLGSSNSLKIHRKELFARKNSAKTNLLLGNKFSEMRFLADLSKSRGLDFCILVVRVISLQ